jgi:hypothetical protein
LRAGAVAVKHVGWFRAMAGNSRTTGAGCYDLDDTTNDQVFDPTYATDATDQAVNLTLGSVLQQGGTTFYTHFWSGASSDSCAAITAGTKAGWMSQWGTKTCADQGRDWPSVVNTFYSSATWKYLRNLILNPQTESPQLYPWSTTPTASIARVSGPDAFDGTSWLKVSGLGGTANAWQTRPFVGPASATYHAEAAFRCPPLGSVSCSISMKVSAITAGGTVVQATRTVIVPRDGIWRVALFDPPAFGVDHVKVRLAFESDQAFNVDGIFLKRSG